ncbi:putative ATP-dependent RNA helicase TDRD12 isoform X2 [Python bivittatus]|uniref:RNA helicase n=1 Tax=Python bivittatus TaxID=176946 RepID=A0A9F5IGY9_PYTBI|nr:putative ATP-dependent RNA helicase TDRD12 isoform X2 [Python bivittatus]
MIEVFILKIENPDSFWVCIKGGRKFVDNEMEYKTLQTEMNLFYNKSYRCVDEVKPSALEEGQVCAVYCQELKSWCRAVVKSIISCTDYYVAECFLVDYAKSVHVKTEKICVALKSFMRLPYRAKKFRLYCVKPVTLRVNYYSDNAEIVPANKWDIAAIQHLQNLLNAATQVEAKLCAVEEDSFAVCLYVTRRGEKVCVNDDLVAKNFACYEISKTNQKQVSGGAESLSEEKNPVLLQWPMLWQESKVSEMRAAPVCDNSEKAEYKYSPETNLHNREESDVMMSLPPLKQGITISVPTDMQTVSNLHEKTTKIQEVEDYLYDNNFGMKLLQFLNPDPLKTANGQETEELQLNITTHFPVVLSNKIEPCSSLETAPLFPALKKELLRNQFLGPNHVQSYSWPAIARGYDSLIISPANDPLSYLLPIITFLQSRSCYISLPARNGPVALIICPGQKKAELVFELLENYSHCSRPLHPILLFLGMNKEEIKSVRIPRGCELMVTTPQSLLRLLEHQSLLFLRLCHLVLDEVDVLFSEAGEQILTILEYYKTNLNVEEKESAPQQIVAVGNHWDKNIEYLTKEFMNDPYIVITSMEEAAIYGKVHQVVQLCLECDRISTLLQTLDFTPTDAQKTLVFTSSVEETDIVYKAVASTSLFCLKMNPEIGFHSDYIVEQWNKKFSSGTHVVLVLTDACMAVVGFTDATRVIHFSFPATPRIFGARLYGMSANFQNSVKKISSLEKEQSKAKSILLLTEKSACHAIGVLHYLKRTEANIPSELCNFTNGVLEAKEERRSRQPFCRFVKAYGICKNKKHCPDRHRISHQIDVPSKVADETLSTAGNVTILPLFIVDATNYFGRIVGKWSNPFAALEKEIKDYYQKSSNLTSVDTVEKLAIYGLQEENSFHRVQVLEVQPKEDTCVFYSVHIKYIDEGRTGYVQNYRLLSLPEQFQALPPQAVEFIVCRVKPIDNEAEWNPKVTRYINHKIRGKLHEAKIVLVLGNTIWVDPVVRVTRLQDLKTSINEYSIRSEILSTGLGVDNPGHVQELKKLFKEAEIAHEEKDTPALIHPLMHGKDEKAESAEQNVSDPATLNSETPNKQAMPTVQKSQKSLDIIHDSSSQVPLQNHRNETVQNKKTDDSPQTLHECLPTIIGQMLPGSSQGACHGEILAPLNSFSSSQSLHPTIKWFDKQDVVVVKIKLQNISRYDCRIFAQRITFSAWAKGKFYLADMELQRSILKDESTCVLKGDGPTIILVKVKKERWCNLLKQKNPHVSFDFDYLDDHEERSPLPVGSGPKKTHQVPTVVCEEEEESMEDSNSESDLSSC